ncbi:(2R)-3-sulfolactate dehydrogenase (NADP+) [Octadecabacter temperatus]|uniref:(2R)-3-sulfolactate dehydrogenase (NADP(+)) n=1 Tax=Octadecabacter temperatus TaxID=1458307 RepID=A0A0K0Y7B3_9RHOB|nr:Ldh family oxidoreductase [Octadecabacter temperatus]AKS46747.1 (2R)-3-sulfolactate dehydrogenase (NADP(+)) [Octadecabacter temperatus]SIO20460.1 (2R)-3-sulfolactate dehydrogenase (NADP+) [Octadecabacter temperatus]
MKVFVSEIEDVAKAAMVAHGAGDWQAGEVARAVARAEAFGNVICGLYYLESYCTQLRSGRVDGQVDPVVSRPKAGQVIADARFGFAQPAFSRGLSQAIEAARENGVATLAVAHAHTCTSLGFFTEQIAAAGLVGIGFTNASPVVAPPNGNKAVIGTNPISMSLPNGGMHWDFSTSAVALGKITMAKAAGESIPLGWAVDADGKPTTDPEAALKGALVSAGGYKGWGFGLMAEVLAAGMTGSVNSLDVNGLKLPDGKPHDLGQFYILLEPGADFGVRLSRVAQAVAEQEGARIPGQNRQPMGEIDVPDALWTASRALAKV